MQFKWYVTKEIPIVFHNESNYDYCFIIKELAIEFKEKFNCLREDTKKGISFSFPLEEEVTRIDKNREEILKTISYKLQFIDSPRFMVISL